MDNSKFAKAMKQFMNIDDMHIEEIRSLTPHQRRCAGIPYDFERLIEEDRNPDAGAVHLDDGKPDMSLLPYEGLAGAALAFQDGIRPGKYQRNDWRKGMDHSRMIAAIMRHASRRAGGELIDPDSGLPHEYMIAARSLMLATFTMTGTGNDDLTTKA